MRFLKWINNFVGSKTQVARKRETLWVAIYLRKYAVDSSRSQNKKWFKGFELPRLEIAHSGGNISTPSSEEEFEPDSGIVVEIELPDGSRSAGRLIINSDVALEIAHGGVGPLSEISATVTIVFGGIHVKGKPTCVKAMPSSESAPLVDEPVKLSVSDEPEQKVGLSKLRGG